MKRWVCSASMVCLLLPWSALATTPAAVGLNPLPLNLSVNCPSGRPGWMSDTVPAPIDDAVVITILSKTAGQKNLSDTEESRGEMIDPAYANDQRVVLQWRLAPGKYARSFAVVPPGMVVHVSEEVAFTPYHGDPNNFCYFVPSLISP